MIVLILSPNIRWSGTLPVFTEELKPRVFTLSSNKTFALGTGRGTLLKFAGCSTGEDEVPTYWPVRKTKRKATAYKRIRFRGNVLGRDRGGRPLPSMDRFSSYTPRRMA